MSYTRHLRHELVTLEEARRFVEENMDKGFICPCCDRPGKVRPRVFNAGMATCLLWLVRQHQLTGGWVNFQHSGNVKVLKNREWAKLEYWNLAVPKMRERSRADGEWKPTEKGIRFAHGKCLIPTHVFTYSGSQVLGFSTSLMRIYDAVPFDVERFLKGEG